MSFVMWRPMWRFVLLGFAGVSRSWTTQNRFRKAIVQPGHPARDGGLRLETRGSRESQARENQTGKEAGKEAREVTWWSWCECH